MLKKIFLAGVFFVFTASVINAEANANTIDGAVRSVVLGQDSCNPIIGDADSPAVKTLIGMTTFEIIFQVDDYVRGEVPLEALEITKENHAQFLAAAKIIDLIIPIENQQNSTFQIRYIALNKSDGMMGKPYFNTAINAFSIPPADESDPILLNALDNRHPQLQQMNPQQREEYRLKICRFAQKETHLHPEFLEVVKKVTAIFATNLENLQSILTPPKAVLYSGTSGTGKSTALKKNFKNIDLDTYIASTDNFIRALSNELDNHFSDSQLFFLGVCLRKEFDPAIKDKYITPSFIQEGWFTNANDIPAFFQTSLPIEVNDFDGDLRLISLRTILRARSPDGRPTLPWDEMTKGFKQSRQCRPVIYGLLKEKDSYQLQYSYNDGTIKIYSLEEAQSLSLSHLEESINEEIKTVAQSLITKDDAAKYGETLLEFEGMTISEAFEYAQHPVQQKPGATKRFTVLFTGDTHSHLENTLKIAHRILLEKQNPENGEVIVADVGDMLTGTEYFEISKGALEFDMMNLAGYHIATIGNHEFDAGWSNLKEVLGHAAFDIVCANIYDVETNKLISEPYKIYPIGGLNVAFVGIIGRDAWNSIRPSAKLGLEIHDPDTVLDELLPQLETCVDAIFLLSHSGIVADRQFAARHIQLDAILGGHSHTYMSEPELIQVMGENKRIPVFHAFKHGEFLGKFTMEMDNNKKRHYTQLIKMDHSQEPQGTLFDSEEQIKNKLLAVSEQIEKIYSRVISICVEPLSKDEIKNKVVPIGRDLVCHVLRESGQADAAFYPSGGIRIGLEKGPITLGTIVQLIPNDRLLTYKVRGIWLRQLMEEGERRWPSRTATFQNIGIEINRSSQEITVNGKALQDEVVYRVSGPAFFFEKELLDSRGNLMEKYADMVDPDFEEYPEETRTVLINWLENNELPPYLEKAKG